MDAHVAAAPRTSSSGIVPSATTAATAWAPHAAAMADPGRRAGGEVMLPCATTVAASATPQAREAHMVNRRY